MSLAASAFLYMALATSGGALAFLTGQRASGRTPREVEACHEQAMLLDRVAEDLRSLCDEADKAEAPDEAREELRQARDRLEEAIAGLRRGADLVV